MCVCARVNLKNFDVYGEDFAHIDVNVNHPRPKREREFVVAENASD